jgi:hypothetical protein
MILILFWLRIYQPEKDGAVGLIDGDKNLIGGRGIGDVGPAGPQTRVKTVGLICNCQPR